MSKSRARLTFLERFEPAPRFEPAKLNALPFSFKSRLLKRQEYLNKISRRSCWFWILVPWTLLSAQPASQNPGACLDMALGWELMKMGSCNLHTTEKKGYRYLRTKYQMGQPWSAWGEAMFVWGGCFDLVCGRVASKKSVATGQERNGNRYMMHATNTALVAAKKVERPACCNQIATGI